MSLRVPGGQGQGGHDAGARDLAHLAVLDRVQRVAAVEGETHCVVAEARGRTGAVGQAALRRLAGDGGDRPVGRHLAQRIVGAVGHIDMAGAVGGDPGVAILFAAERGVGAAAVRRAAAGGRAGQQGYLADRVGAVQRAVGEAEQLAVAVGRDDHGVQPRILPGAGRRDLAHGGAGHRDRQIARLVEGQAGGAVRHMHRLSVQFADHVGQGGGGGAAGAHLAVRVHGADGRAVGDVHQPRGVDRQRLR